MDKMNVAEQREKMIPFTVIIGLIVLFLIFCFTCLSLTFKGTYTLHYSEMSKLDYDVYLKENAWGLYNGKKYLEKDKIYVASTIDYIDTKFDYSFKSDEKIDTQYSYYVTATVDYQDTDGKDFGNDYEEVILESGKLNTIQNQTFSIDEAVKIDYAKYNQIATSFITGTGVTAEANLVVSLYVDVIGTHADFEKKISDNAAITMTIPLVNKTVDVTMDYDLSNSYDETLQYKSTIINIPVLFYACIFLAVADLAAMICIIVWIIKNRDENTLYKKKLKRILSDYDKYISETVITERVEDLMKTKSLRIVVVKSFEGLIDIRDNLNVPILYQEEVPGKEASFYIINEGIGYIYVMRASEIKKGSEVAPVVTAKTKTTKKKSEEMSDVVVEKIEYNEEPVVVAEELNEVAEEITDEDMKNIESLLNQDLNELKGVAERIQELSVDLEETTEEQPVVPTEEQPVVPTEDKAKAKAKAKAKRQRYYRGRR